jgi:hypothetical protein
MGHKAVDKPKAKPSYATPNALTRKLSGGKTYQYGKGLKLPGLKPQAALVAGVKLKPSEMEIHDAGHGLKYAVVANIGQEKYTPAENEADLAGKLVAEVADTSADVNVLCRTYYLKREELGRLTGFSLRALAAWAAGELPSQPAKRRLHEVRRLLDALAEIVKREHIPKWLHQRNAVFDDMTPLQVIEFGEIDRLWAMVYDLGSGQPS